MACRQSPYCSVTGIVCVTVCYVIDYSVLIFAFCTMHAENEIWTALVVAHGWVHVPDKSPPSDVSRPLPD